MRSKTKKDDLIFKKVISLIFLFLLFIASIPLIAISLEIMNSPENCIVSKDENNKDVSISFDKEHYVVGEEAVLDIYNLGDSNIYLEPCNELGVFEIKEGDEWYLWGEEIEYDYFYKEGEFEKQTGSVLCEIDIPESSGIYRLVVPVFYDCKEPNKYTCTQSKIFYSNEFEIVSGESL